MSRLTLYDIAHTPGVAADLSHIETRANVKGTGCDCLGDSTIFPAVASVWVVNRIIDEQDHFRVKVHKCPNDCIVLDLGLQIVKL